MLTCTHCEGDANSFVDQWFHDCIHKCVICADIISCSAAVHELQLAQLHACHFQVVTPHARLCVCIATL